MVQRNGFNFRSVPRKEKKGTSFLLVPNILGGLPLVDFKPAQGLDQGGQLFEAEASGIEVRLLFQQQGRSEERRVGKECRL